jgi:predicted SAM-dependent methyltransferase
MAKKLDIGCGRLNKAKIAIYQRYLGSDYDPKQYIGVDIVKLPGVDKVCDITKKLPFKNKSVDEIICIHTLEHVRNLIPVMKEFHRILKPNGILRIWVPHCFSAIAYGLSTHERFFTYETFLQFDKSHPFSYEFGFNFKFIKSQMQLLRRWYQPNLIEQFLEKAINWKQRQGERFLKILPYKDWEVYFELRKE